MSVIRASLGMMAVWAAATGVWAQAPPAAREAQGLPARTSAADYQAQAQAGQFTIAAEFTGHGIPNAQTPLNSEDYVAVEVALFGPADGRLTITATDFSLRVSGKKTTLPSQPWGLAAKNIKDPEWIPPESAAGPKSKGGISGGGGGQEAGAPPPSPPKPPVELLRDWQQRVRKAALPEGDRALPQAGLLFFAYRGKVDDIRSVELIYSGPAGTATLKLR